MEIGEASGQDGAKGTSFTLSHENSNNNNNKEQTK